MKRAGIFSLIFLIIGFLEGLINNNASMLWYYALNKSVLTPPDFVFPVAWTIFYIILGFALNNILKLKNSKLTFLFITHLLLNFTWSPIFFGLKAPFAAFVVIITMIFLMIPVMFMLFQKSRITFNILLPYLFWIIFASYLNLYIILNN